MAPSLSQFPDFFENSILAKCITDCQGVFTYVNPAYCELYESSKEKLIGQPFTIHFPHLPADDKDVLIREYQSFIQDGNFHRGNFEVKKTIGKRVVVEMIRQLVEVGKQPFVITILKDITENHDLNLAVKASEMQLKAIFESGYQAFIIIDRDFKIVRINAKSQQLFRRMFKKSLDTGSSMLEFSRHFNQNDFIADVNRAMQGEIVEAVRHYKVAEATFWLKSVYEPLTNSKGVIDKVFITTFDVTRTIRAEQEAKKMNEQLQQIIQAQKDQMYIISHDLRSPFNSISGLLDVIELEHDSGNTKEYLGDIRKLSSQGLSIIDALSQLGSIEHGMSVPDFQQTDLSKLVGEVIGRHLLDANRKKQTLETEIEPGIMMEADHKMIHSVVDNLLSNAIKYSPVSGTISVRLLLLDNMINLEVEDHGLGLNPEDMQRLFGKFSRLSARPTGGEKSSGLGLYIAKNFVEAHGGLISAESKGANQGATFRVQLPVSKVSEKLKKVK